MLKIFSYHILKWKLLMVLGDCLIYCLSVIGALYLNPKLGLSPLDFLEVNGISFFLIGLVYFTIFYIADLYNFQEDFRPLRNISKTILSTWTGTLAIIVLFYFPLGVFIGRTLIIIQSLLLTLLLVLWRWTFSALALPTRLRRRLLIVGAGKAGCSLLAAIRERPNCGLEAVGFVDDNPQKMGTQIDGLPVLGDSTMLPELVRQQNLNLVVVAVTHDKSHQLITALSTICWNGCSLVDMPSLYEILTNKIAIEHISDIWIYLNSLQANRLYYKHYKRIFDLVLSMLLLAISLPLFIIIPLAIKLDSLGPVFFRQDRVGQNGKIFRILKFRTMIDNAEPQGPQWTGDNDPRITRVGRALRIFRLDELPQLINIFKGEMSFVGPRPEREVFIKKFQELIPDLRPGGRDYDPPGTLIKFGYQERIPYYSYRLVVKPGLSGWAQIMYPYASSLEETQEKLKYDLYYIKNMGGVLDLAIILKTIRIVLLGQGK